MKRLCFALGLLFLFSFVSAVPVTEISYFYSVTCSHCQAVAEDGILDRIALMEGVSVEKYETTSPVNRERYLDYLDQFGIERGGIPFLVIEQGEEFSYMMGDVSIIEDLEDSIVNFRSYKGDGVDIVRGELSL